MAHRVVKTAFNIIHKKHMVHMLGTLVRFAHTRIDSFQGFVTISERRMEI